MPNGIKTSQAMEERIIDLLKQGVKQTEIVRITGISRHVISRIANETGIRRAMNGKSICDKKQHYPDELLEEWDRLHEKYGRK